MLEKILYSLNEISLLAGILWLGIQCLWGNFTSKDYFHTAKIAILSSIAFSILFYNRSLLPEYFMVTPFTALFYVLSAFIAFAWLSLSFRWFTSEDVPGCLFCVLVLAALFCFNLVISTVNLGILFAALLGVACINYGLVYLSQENEELHPVSRYYAKWAFVFALIMAAALYCLSYENWNYGLASEALGTMPAFKQYLVTAGLIFFVIFLLGIAPLHFWFADTVAPAILPVAAYFNVVPFFVLWGVFIKLNYEVLTPVRSELAAMYVCFGLISAVLGAIGANSSRNLRKIFASAGLYNYGVILLILATFTPESVLSSFVYMQVYLLALFGMYTAFYSFKSGGAYLNNVAMISGIAKVRPYISGAALFFMASLMGIAPLPGFLGQLAALYTFAGFGEYFVVFIVLISMLAIMAAFLHIIYTMYFAKRQTDFDRPDYGVYLYLLINIIIIAVLIFRPHFLLHDAEIILSSVLN